MSSVRFQLLEARLNTLQETHKNTLQLINRLLNLKFQAGAYSSEYNSTGVRTELTSEIHENLKREDEELEILRQEVHESTSTNLSSSVRRDGEKEREQTRLAIQITRLGEDFINARARFRAAQIESKRNAQLARAEERRQLFSSKSEGLSEDSFTRRRNTDRTKGNQDEAVAASGDVTDALRRAQRLLLAEVQRSHFAQEIFDQSTEAIQQLSTQYNDLDSLLASSKTLLSTLVTSQKSDTWYLETTFYLLAGTVAWLVFRRFLYGPLWWFAWLPLKLLYRLIAITFFGIFGISKVSTTNAASLSGSTIGQSATLSMQYATMSSQGAQDSKGNGERGVENTELKGDLSREIADMVDKKDGEKEPPRRGDGTALVDSDAPRNPKKRVLEVGNEPQKGSKSIQKDEL